MLKLDLEEGKDSNSVTPLHVACWAETNPEIIDELLKHNTFVNAADVNGQTPLLVACRQSNVEAVRRLMKQGGVDVNAVGVDGQCALSVVVRNRKKCWSIASLLLKGGTVNTKSITTAMDNHHGTSFLHEVCRHGQVQVLKTLLGRYDVSLVARDATGLTPLESAALCRQTDMVYHLLREQNAFFLMRPDLDH
mmetsp:Transcript_16139/g.44407  ORF Transcript_16139/g.44407 Transcript_16139/m.44407 type:complete len:193 (-) Transcript_16139:45-623(-)